MALVFARNWALSWWEWHVLLLAAFVLVVVGVRIQWYEERFSDLYLEDTVSGQRELSVLFADLQGFTTFSENHDSAEVTAMLNTYFQVVVPPVVRRHGGDVDRIIGDALMVTFNKRGNQPDHAARAAAAGLALQEAATAVQAAHPDWPRFRVGINSGIASVSLLGTEGGRTHTVIGDTVNVASRIEGKAPGGGVAIGPGTKALLPDAVTESLGLLDAQGQGRAARGLPPGLPCTPANDHPCLSGHAPGVHVLDLGRDRSGCENPAMSAQNRPRRRLGALRGHLKSRRLRSRGRDRRPRRRSPPRPPWSSPRCTAVAATPARRTRTTSSS